MVIRKRIDLGEGRSSSPLTLRGSHSQKDIVAVVKSKTEKGDRKIREILLHFSHGPHAEIHVKTTGRGKDLLYSLLSPFEDVQSTEGESP